MFGLGFQELLLILIIVGIPVAIVLAVRKWGRGTDGEAQLVGIGGWLVLVAIGVCLTPLLLFGETVQALDKADHVTAVVSGALGIWGVVNAVLFFKHKRHFPKAWIALNVVLAVLIVLGTLVESDTSAKAQAVGPLFWTVVWVAYMLRSRRVKATFVQ